MAATPGIMWNPTHIQFSVLRARNLVSKGKNGTNDVFVCIQLGKEKYQTSVIKHTHHPEWFEECDMPIPHMHTEVQITLYHRGVLSDDFLGYTAIPLWEYKVYERPKSQWLQLQGRPGKSPDTKKRGEIEVRITFNVKSKSDTLPAGLVQSKKRSSIRNIATAVGDKLKGRSRSFRDNKDHHHESFVHRDLHPQHSSDSDTDSHSTLVASDDEDYHESHKPSTKVSTSSSSASSDENIPDFEKYKITRTVPNRPIRRKNPRGTIAPDSEKVGAMKKMDSSVGLPRGTY